MLLSDIQQSITQLEAEIKDLESKGYILYPNFWLDTARSKGKRGASIKRYRKRWKDNGKKASLNITKEEYESLKRQIEAGRVLKLKRKRLDTIMRRLAKVL